MAVLSKDLLAESAEIFLWPGGDLPSQPDVFTLPVEELSEGDRLGLLDRSVLTNRPSLGATVVDSLVHGLPVIVGVNPGGAADRAGLSPGEELAAIEGTEISSVAGLMAALEGAQETHADTRIVKLDVVSIDGTRRQVDLPLALSSRILSHRDTEVLFSAAAWELRQEAQSEDPVAPSWLVDLNLAVVFLHGRDLQGATDLLRGLDTPDEAVLGAGMADYYLGLAAMMAGAEYAENARTFLERAAAGQSQRLFHDDGPLVAPRAKARLEGLN